MKKDIAEKLKDKIVLITGGTGSLGQALTKKLLETEVKTIRILSRNENKQVTMETQFDDKRLRFFIGDVREIPRLFKAFEGVDVIFHAAALKHVPVVEYNPFEGIKTNVVGSQNVIDACMHEKIPVATCVGTDKAVSPLNTYGATKLLMEKLFVAANPYWNSEETKTKFIALRYGNVLGSSGSVVPKFIKQIREKQKITITDPNMTRFSLTMNETLDFILESTFLGKSSEVFVPKLRAYSIMDLKDALVELVGEAQEEIISIRPGEKLHETLINHDEIRYAWEINNMYMLANPHYKLFNDSEILENYDGIKKVEGINSYSSDTVEKITKEELKEKIKNSGLLD